MLYYRGIYTLATIEYIRTKRVEKFNLCKKIYLF